MEAQFNLASHEYSVSTASTTSHDERIAIRTQVMNQMIDEHLSQYRATRRLWKKESAYHEAALEALMQETQKRFTATAEDMQDALDGK